MKRFVYKKLVRDNVLDILKDEGATASFRILGTQEFIEELKKKLIEEAHELQKTRDHDELLEELADVVEVVERLITLFEFTAEEIETARHKKNKKRGAFSKGLFIDYIDAPDNSYTAHYCSQHPEKYTELTQETSKKKK